MALSAGLEQTLSCSCSWALALAGLGGCHRCIRPAEKEGEFPFPVDLLLVAEWVTKPELAQWIRKTVPSLQFPGSPAAKGSEHQDFLQGDSPRAKRLHAGPPSLQRLVSMVPALAFKVASEIVSGCPSRQKSTAGVLQAHMATSPPLAGLEEDRALPGGPLCRLM